MYKWLPIFILCFVNIKHSLADSVPQLDDMVDFHQAIDSDNNSSQQQFFTKLDAGEQVYEPPEQHTIEDFKWIEKGHYQLGYTDHFVIRGMILSTRHYIGDEKADIAPYDIVLGWNRMSDPKIVRHINIRQNNRFYYWRVKEFPIPREEIELSSTNLHIVPDTPEIAQQLAALKRGDVVSLTGYLTDIKDENDFIWATSRSRKDSGDGACEIMLIKQMSVIKQASR